MNKLVSILAISVISMQPASAETNALIEVEVFKDWVIKGEVIPLNFNIAIKNIGTDLILLAKHPLNFDFGQLAVCPFPRNPNLADETEKQDFKYQMAVRNELDGFFELPSGETHMYEGRKFFAIQQFPFSEEMRFTVSVYLGKGFWVDSEPVTLKGVVPDSEEKVATITTINDSSDLMAVTYKNKRWLYSKERGFYFAVCPISLTNKIRVEPHEGAGLFKIWDGDKSMIYRDGQSILTEGPDENDVFGKWTRERKQRAETDNAEVRRKKAEEAE